MKDLLISAAEAGADAVKSTYFRTLVTEKRTPRDLSISKSLRYRLRLFSPAELAQS